MLLLRGRDFSSFKIKIDHKSRLKPSTHLPRKLDNGETVKKPIHWIPHCVDNILRGEIPSYRHFSHKIEEVEICTQRIISLRVVCTKENKKWLIMQKAKKPYHTTPKQIKEYSELNIRFLEILQWIYLDPIVRLSVLLYTLNLINNWIY